MSRQAGPGIWLTRSLLGLILVLAGVAGCGSSSPAPQTQRLQARATYERGLGYLRDRQAGLALRAFRDAVAFDGTVALYHNTLGLVLMELGRPEVAAESFERALALDPGYADARLNLGISLAERGRWDQAASQYRTALTMPALTAESVARQNLGLALYHLRSYEAAESELRFAIALDPRMEAAHYNLGLVLVATGRRSDARAAFQHVRDTAPGTPFGRAAIEQLRSLGDGS